MLSACAADAARKTPTSDTSTSDTPTGDPFVVAQGQALALGQVLVGIELCDGIAWQTTLNEFMAIKRQRGLNDTQVAMIAAMTGAGEAQAGPEMLDCSPEGAARRAAALSEMRTQW